jgi:hypothetical protein
MGTQCFVVGCTSSKAGATGMILGMVSNVSFFGYVLGLEIFLWFLLLSFLCEIACAIANIVVEVRRCPSLRLVEVSGLESVVMVRFGRRRNGYAVKVLQMFFDGVSFACVLRCV